MIYTKKRLDFFISLGCRSSDHGLEYVPFTLPNDNEFNIEKAFKKAKNGEKVSQEENDIYKTMMLIFLAKMYARKNIVMQLHVSVLRNINTNQFIKIGANSGFDSVNDRCLCEALSCLLNYIEFDTEKSITAVSNMPKTILYSLNPKDYYSIATIMNGFQDSSCVGKMQLGSAWWFCDHKDGMEEQMRILANLGMLPAFVGMITDSRSFLSYPRHEYFRRILCNLIGKWVENGEYSSDMEKLKNIVRDICFENAKRYFEKI